MKTKLLASAIVAGTMFCAAAATADSISGGSGTIGQAQTSWESNTATGGSSTAGTPNTEAAMTLNAFDTALGTLTSVEFFYSYSVLGNVTVTNTGTSSLTYTEVLVKPLVQYDLFNDATAPNAGTEAFNSDTFTLFSDAFGTTLTNPGDFDVYGVDRGNSGSFIVTSGLTAFESTYDFGCSADIGNSVTTTSGTGQVGFDGTAACSVDVVFTYDAATVTPPPPSVPVPATVLLFGLGLLGFGTRLKSKKA